MVTIIKGHIGMELIDSLDRLLMMTIVLKARLANVVNVVF